MTAQDLIAYRTMLDRSIGTMSPELQQAALAALEQAASEQQDVPARRTFWQMITGR